MNMYLKMELEGLKRMEGIGGNDSHSCNAGWIDGCRGTRRGAAKKGGFLACLLRLLHLKNDKQEAGNSEKTVKHPHPPVKNPEPDRKAA